MLKESLNHNACFQLVFDFDVDYTVHVPQVDISVLHEKDSSYMLKPYIGSKSLSWKHEKECRLIFEGKGLFDIDYRTVTGIYFGCRMNDCEIDSIMNNLKGRGLNYYKMELVKNSYKFIARKIEDRYVDAPKYIANNLDYDINELLMPADVLGEKAYSYKNKLVEALDIVKQDPLIKEIYIATINMDTGEPLFIVWAYTKSGIPVSKEYKFKLNEKGEILKIK